MPDDGIVALDDTTPPVPQPISRIFDFYAWQATHPLDPLPGGSVNNEFDRTNNTVNNVIERLALIQRDDGGLINGIVGLDQLDPVVLDEINQDVSAAQGFADAAHASADAAAISAADAAASAVAADSSETDAEAAQAAAETARNAAAVYAAQAGNAAAAMPPLPGPPNQALVVNPAGDAYTFKTVILKAADGIFDTLGIKLRGVDAAAPTEYVTLQQAQSMSGGASGNVPPPVAGDAGKALVATGAATYNWVALTIAMITDVTAYMRGLLTTINSGPALLAAIGGAPAAQAVPVPANPADDGKALKAQGGAFSWQTITGGVPVPADPADNLKGLRANAGAYAWSIFNEPPVPVAGDTGKLLVVAGAGAGNYAYVAVPAAAGQATEVVAGIAQVATQAEADAGAIDTDFITPLKLITHIATRVLAAARAVTARWTFTDPVIVTQALAVAAGVVDWNCALGHQGQLALSANATINAPTGVADGGYYHLEIVNAGAFTLAWNTYYHFADGTAPTITPSGRDEFVFHRRGAAFYEIGRNQNVV